MTHKSKILTTTVIAVMLAVSAGPTFAQGMGWGPGGGMGRGMGRADAPWSERFKAIDENADGAISQAENTAQAGQVFDAMDVDSNGKVTREEYMALRLGTQRGWNKARQDSRQASKAGRYAAMDANDDGTLDRTEFVAGAAARFRAADRNRDAKLTPAEFRRQAW